MPRIPFAGRSYKKGYRRASYSAGVLFPEPLQMLKPTDNEIPSSGSLDPLNVTGTKLWLCPVDVLWGSETHDSECHLNT